jgi:hypothetical protein
MKANRTTLYAETPGITGIKTLLNNIKEKYFKTKFSIGYILSGSLLALITLLIIGCSVHKYRNRSSATSDYIVTETPQYPYANQYYMALRANNNNNNNNNFMNYR